MRSLEQLSFSSQFYFLGFMGLTGNLWMIMGFMVILQAGLNPYEDILVFPMLFINQLIIIAVEKLTLLLRRRLKIWEEKPAKNDSEKDQKANTPEASPVVDTETNPINNHKIEIAELTLDIGGKKKESILKRKGTNQSETFQPKGLPVSADQKENLKDNKENPPKDAALLDIYYKFREYTLNNLVN